MDKAIAIALLAASLGFTAYAQEPQDEAATNTPPKRVKVELQQPVQVSQSLQFVGSVQEIVPTQLQVVDAKKDYMKPTLSPIVQDFMQKVQEAITEKIPEILAQSLSSAISEDVPKLLEIALANVDNIQVPAIASVAMAHATKEQIPEILAQSLQYAISEDVPKLLEIALANADSMQIPAIASVAMAHATKATAPAILAQIYDKLVMAQSGKYGSVETIKIKKQWYEKFVAKGGSKADWILKIANERAERGQGVDDLKQIFDDVLKSWLEEEEEDNEEEDE